MNKDKSLILKKQQTRRKSTPSSVDRTGLVQRFVIPVIVFFWPFLYLFHHVIPINGQYTAIGNDFIALYCRHKIYLLSCLSQGHFPLWSPAEGAGYPFRDNPFAQAMYPFNLLLLIWFKIVGGYAPLDHQVFTVFGVAIFALGLFMWLRLLNSNIRAVVFSVLVMSVSFKMTEILRFPNAVHTAAWYPWILYALTKIMFSRSLKSTVACGVLVVASVFFCTGGYPYFLYYSIFLFTPYFLVFLIKPLRSRLFGNKVIEWKRAFMTLAMAAVVVLLMCGPYLYRSKRLIAETAGRPQKDFAYSTRHTFTFEDTVGSLVYPPVASAEGWYFFSITALLMVCLYLLNCRGREVQPAADISEGTPPNLCSVWLKLFLVGWIAVITYITYGRYSYLFILLWKFMPAFSTMRIWPRLNIILVPIIAWLLSISYAWFELLISDKDVAAGRERLRRFSPVVTVMVVYAVVLGSQLYLYLNKMYNPYWHEYFKNVLSHDVKFIIYGVGAFVVVFSILVFGMWIQPTSKFKLGVVLAVLVCVASVEMRHVGAHMWTADGRPWSREERIYPDIAKFNEVSFRVPRTDFNNSIPLGPNFSVGILENWYFDRYAKFLQKTQDQLQARRILLGVVDGRKLFFSESIEHSSVESFLNDAARYHPAVKLLSYTGDELNLHVDTPVEGYLSFIDNWDYGWRVFVDEKEAAVELLFGTFKSVWLVPGSHHVRFSYQPGYFRFPRNFFVADEKNGFYLKEGKKVIGGFNPLVIFGLDFSDCLRFFDSLACSLFNSV